MFCTIVHIHPFLISRNIIQEQKFILAFRRNLSALFLRVGRGYTFKMFISVVVIKQDLIERYTVIDSVVVFCYVLLIKSVK